MTVKILGGVVKYHVTLCDQVSLTFNKSYRKKRVYLSVSVVIISFIDILYI